MEGERGLRNGVWNGILVAIFVLIDVEIDRCGGEESTTRRCVSVGSEVNHRAKSIPFVAT